MKSLETILKILASLILKKFKPKIIAITGTVGKTSTKEAILTVLSHFVVRGNIKSYNNTLGVPLTILGSETGGKNIFKWLVIFIRAFLMIIFPKKLSNYPGILVLELGIDRPGDMDYFLSFIKPDIGIITAVGEAPVHVEFFKSRDALGIEKVKIVSALSNGAAIINCDDPFLDKVAKRLEFSVLTFGFEEGATVRIMEYKTTFDGTFFKIEHAGNVVPFRLPGALGIGQVYASAAATATGIFFKMNLVNISQALLSYKPPPGRMKILPGIKESLVIDDTYNASPMAMQAALETLNEFEASRKIAVLGDMLELGEYTEEAHRQIGKFTAQFLDYLFVIGLRAKFISDEAKKNGLEENRIFEFNKGEEAIDKLQKIIQEEDLILVKGSQGMRMERIVEGIMAEPNKAKDLLVRQDKAWKNK